jgi:hypothetical protein
VDGREGGEDKAWVNGKKYSAREDKLGPDTHHALHFFHGHEHSAKRVKDSCFLTPLPPLSQAC